LNLFLDGGNVLRPSTSFKISMRLPPTLDADKALETLTKILTTDVPYGAEVTITNSSPNSGWDAPKSKEWLSESINNSSKNYFEKPVVYQGEGGSIPFMGLLGKMFPKAQFCIAGVLGPASNAHGPNEFLHIPFAEKLTCCITAIVADHEKVKE
jgi:acetylornithine deacetylase/succinyl-diaminopimelate desuccinylase-like protein